MTDKKMERTLNRNYRSSLDQLRTDFYGGLHTVGFKATTTNKLEHIENINSKLAKRINELEQILLKSGIIEELDTSDIVELPNQDPWSFTDSTQYVVNKVKI